MESMQSFFKIQSQNTQAHNLGDNGPSVSTFEQSKTHNHMLHPKKSPETLARIKKKNGSMREERKGSSIG